MTSLAQLNHNKPLEIGPKMSESGLLSPSLQTVWEQHRVGIIFVVVMLSAIFIVFMVLIVLKLFEKRQSSEQQSTSQQLQGYVHGLEHNRLLTENNMEGCSVITQPADVKSQNFTSSSAAGNRRLPVVAVVVMFVKGLKTMVIKTKRSPDSEIALADGDDGKPVMTSFSARPLQCNGLHDVASR